MTLPFPNSPDSAENIATSISRIEQNLEYLDGQVSLTSFFVKYTLLTLDTNDDVPISLVGFRPTAVICFAQEGTGESASWGSCDTDLNHGNIRLEFDGDTGGDNNYLVNLYQTATKTTNITVKEFTGDGCTLTVAATDNPVGSGSLMLLFFK